MPKNRVKRNGVSILDDTSLGISLRIKERNIFTARKKIPPINKYSKIGLTEEKNKNIVIFHPSPKQIKEWAEKERKTKLRLTYLQPSQT